MGEGLAGMFFVLGFVLGFVLNFALNSALNSALNGAHSTAGKQWCAPNGTAS